ncbi:hypothetical protein LEP3755_07820 [Leptolyngbya sp. NIES-3755]|nr:hypothetical protein LEP3755_07820 [Leptolyngbya sp. NIES-3755]
MSSQFEQVLYQVQQLSAREQLQLIHHLVNQNLPALSSPVSKEHDFGKIAQSHSIIGSFEDDPQFDQFLEAIAQYRRELDAELEVEQNDLNHPAA